MKLVLVLISLGLAIIAGITVLQKKTMNKPTQQGRVIVFDGSSSAGKSSVIKQLIPLLDSSYQPIAVDDFVTEVFVAQKTVRLPEEDFIKRVNERVDVMYDTIKSLVGQKKNILLDTVLSGLEGEQSIRYQLEKLKNLPVVMILVYCPLHVLTERIRLRNERAKQHNRPEDERSFGLSLKQFATIYRKKTKDAEISLGALSRHDADSACELCKEEFAGNGEQFNRFKTWFLSQLGLQDAQEVIVTPRLHYDCVVNTAEHTPQECARSIKGCLT